MTSTPHEGEIGGLSAGDELMATLANISGRPVPQKYRRQRSQLVDAMLDGHFYFGGKSVALGAEPDMLLNIAGFLADMGCAVAAAVTTTTSPILAQVPSDEVLIGDLEDLERRAEDCDLLLTHSHGRQAAERLIATAARPRTSRTAASRTVTPIARRRRETFMPDREG